MNDLIYEIENIIPIDYQNYIEETMMSFNFPWFYNKNLVSPDEPFLGREDNHQGFNHFFYEEGRPSTFFEAFYPLVLSITSKNIGNCNKLIRMRANLTLNNSGSTIEHHLPHIDSWYPHWVAIYYVNDSDGDTYIFNEINDNYDSGIEDVKRIEKNKFTIKKRITPKKGKVLLFEGKYYHTSSWPKKNKYRTVININLDSIALPKL